MRASTRECNELRNIQQDLISRAGLVATTQDLNRSTPASASTIQSASLSARLVAVGARDAPRGGLQPVAADTPSPFKHKASKKVVQRLVEWHLPRKVANMLGIPLADINDSTIVRVVRRYAASEGVMEGISEKFSAGIVGLRIDLQPCKEVGLDDHYGDRNFANFLVQFGGEQPRSPKSPKRKKTKSKKKKKQSAQTTLPSGNFAGVFVPTETDVLFGLMRDALKMSLKHQHYVQIAPANSDFDWHMRTPEVAASKAAKNNSSTYVTYLCTDPHLQS